MRPLYYKFLPITVLFTCIFHCMPVSVADAVELQLSGDKMPTDISGKSGKPINIGNSESNEFGLTGLLSKERSNDPCWVRVYTKSVKTGGIRNEPAKNLCGSRGPRDASLISANFSLLPSLTYVSGVQVCLNRAQTKIKGWKIFGTIFDDDGEIANVLAQPVYIAGPRTNCYDWKREVHCREGHVAVAAKLYYSEGNQPRSWRGIKLVCRKVINPFVLKNTGSNDETSKRNLSELIEV